MMKFEFAATDDKTRRIHHTLVGENLPEVLDAFKDFLLGCGFTIDPKDCVDIVPFDKANVGN